MNAVNNISLHCPSWDCIKETAKDDDKNHRLIIWVVASIMIHAAFLLWMSRSHQQMIINAETFSAPITIEMVFEKQNPIQKKSVTKRVAKAPTPQQVITPTKQTISDTPSPVELNQETPAAGPMTDIPVVKTVSLKGKRIHPNYPKRALQMKQEGTVWLHVLVSASGSREDIRIHKASPYALLNQAALKAVRKWRFEPTVIKNRAVQSWVEIPIEFKIQS